VSLRYVSRDPGGSAGMSPSMWANRKNPRTPCIMVTTEESISSDSANWWI